MSSIKKLLIAVNQKKRAIREKKKVAKTELVLTPYEPKKLSADDYFRNKIKVVGECWEWQGRLDRYGYGAFKVGQKTFKAHRYSYQYHYGSFDLNLHVLHCCDNPRCVNPHHLFLGTNDDNISDKVRKGRSVITYHRLSDIEKRDIIQLLEEGVSMKQIAEQYNLHVGTVRRLNGQRYVS